jgi:hypothetical protein
LARPCPGVRRQYPLPPPEGGGSPRSGCSGFYLGSYARRLGATNQGLGRGGERTQGQWPCAQRGGRAPGESRRAGAVPCYTSNQQCAQPQPLPRWPMGPRARLDGGAHTMPNQASQWQFRPSHCPFWRARARSAGSAWPVPQSLHRPFRRLCSLAVARAAAAPLRLALPLLAPVWSHAEEKK